MSAPNVENPDKLETETCPRCQGSGRHSYNTRHGDLCYGCSGSGRRYTARGAAAAAYLRALREVTWGEIKAGDWVLVAPFMQRSYFGQVVSIGSTETSQLTYGKTSEAGNDLEVVTTHPQRGEGHQITFRSAKIRKGFSAEEKAEQLRKAIEYQGTLTKAGKPRTR